MPAIQELLKLLVTVPVSYHHDRKAITSSVNEKVKILIEKPHQDMMQELREITAESTASWEKRTPLLDYFLSNISSLKLFIDGTEPLSEENLTLLVTNLTQLVGNMHLILNMSDSETLMVRHAEQDIKLDGLLKGLFGGYGTCRSGLILKNTLLSKFEFTKNDPAEINNGIIPALQAHQSHLLIQKQAKLIKSLQEEVVHLKDQIVLLRKDSVMKIEESIKSPRMASRKPSFFDLLQEFFTEENEHPVNQVNINKGPCGRN